MRVLVAEDDPVGLLLLQSHLTKWGYDVETVADGADALDALMAPDGPPLAILDWMMPRLDGLAVCRRLRKAHSSAYKYLILVTGKDRKSDVVEGLEAGADDYLTKPLNPEELRARLRVGHRILDLQNELLATQEVLRVQATRDLLTGLWTRRAILERLDRDMMRGGREASSTAVIMGDLDQFKSINDAHGHAGGDIVLREAANRILESVRMYDAVGRYGGEELLIVLPSCDAAKAMVVAERIRARVATDAIDPAGLNIAITISLGVAIGAPGAVTSELLIGAADTALYRAKREGRNRVELAHALTADGRET